MQMHLFCSSDTLSLDCYEIFLAAHGELSLSLLESPVLLLFDRHSRRGGASGSTSKSTERVISWTVASHRVSASATLSGTRKHIVTGRLCADTFDTAR